MDLENFGNLVLNDLHKIPERSGNETKTREYIRQFAQNLNVPIISDTSLGIVLGILTNDNFSTNFDVGFRAELDAVVLDSINVKHACGHDGHMSSLLTLIAKIIVDESINVTSNILFIFQSSEETGNGAEKLTKHLSKLNVSVDNLIAIHNAPEIAPGLLAYSPYALSNNLTINYIFKAEKYSHIGYNSTLNGWITNIVSILSNEFTNIPDAYIEIVQIQTDGSIMAIPNVLKLTVSIRSTKLSISFLQKIANKLQLKIKMLMDVHITMSILNSHKIIVNSMNLIQRLTKYSNNVLEAPKSLSSDDFGQYSTITKNLAYLFSGSYVSSSIQLHNLNYEMNPKFIINTVKLYLRFLFGEMYIQS